MRLVDKVTWAECAIENFSAVGPFSSDRMIREYVEQGWTAWKRR